MPIETGISNILQTYVTQSQLVALSFLDLNDTPDTYVGQSGRRVKVNSFETGLTFISDAFTTLNDTPLSYAGAGSKLVAVNTGETALEFIANTINSATLGPWEETNKGLVTDWTAGTDIYHSHDAQYYNMIGTTYTTLKTITLDFVPNSTLRIYYEYKATYQSKWNVFRNGVAVGTEKTYNGLGTSWTENISGWADGDILTVKGKCDAGVNCPTNIYCWNLRILCTANKIRNS